ncbi:MAG: hypothetical protein J0I26_10145 [Alphaproteobacteria bacterium]|jgi:hypothetical protein|nr:hypothetical protein [Alphaproteobacteria bacterium]OJU55526.1 MAG: hypothetical protein BGO00_05485 [Alphaproteobacteria bacterium 62-8]MBN9557874.1 hypothetical protein [Alphaproteobacteria bacterium]MBN9567576.1 hypothetical protein [Alphaproteobacteria bacterium]MBN9578397.1 hypothetical protein [Alphaproteobacteria bacterium]
MSQQQQAPASLPEKMTLYTGSLLFLFVLGVIVSWILLGTFVFGITSFFASFLLLWYWASVEKAEISRLPASVIGALVGLALAWQLQFLSGQFGLNGLIAGLIVVAAAVFVQIMNWIPIAVNASAMLFLTALSAPALMTTMNFVEVAEAVGFGAIFFGVAVYLAKLYVDAQTKAKAQTA